MFLAESGDLEQRRSLWAEGECHATRENAVSERSQVCSVRLDGRLGAPSSSAGRRMVELAMYWSNQNSGPTTSKSSTASKPKFTIGCNNLPTIQKLVRRLSSVIEEIKQDGTSQ